jgi:hypothetical protein
MGQSQDEIAAVESVMKSGVVLVGADFDRLLGLSLAIGASAYEVTILRSDDPLPDARNCPGAPAVMLVSLAGRENVADIRALLSVRSETRFLLLTPDHPPRAALARIVRAHGDVILSVDEPDVVVVATLIAINAKRGSAGAYRA